MRKLLVFQHVPFEILGTLNPLLKRAGFRIRYVNFGRDRQAQPSLEGYHGLVVLGGPMNVDEVEEYPHLATETALIGEAMARRIPVLGVCLGAQLIAKALGAAVKPNGEKEIGWYPVALTAKGRRDPLLGHFGNTERIFQWHGDTFEIPTGAVHLASSPSCSHQAFRYRDNIYGLQFHLEVDEAMIQRWLRIPMHRKEIASLGGKVNPTVIRQETGRYMARLKQLGQRTFQEFIRLLGISNKRRALPST